MPETHEKREDLFIAGWPYQPYSVQNQDRFKAGGVQKHPKFTVAQQVVHHLRALKPFTALLENVPGFGMSMRDDADKEREPELDHVLSDIASIKSTKHPGQSQYAVRFTYQDLHDWIDSRRKRTHQSKHWPTRSYI